jgi:adenylylsulfate kinase-like enzyme
MSPSARVIWITGLSGAGKTTLARELVARLREEAVPVVMLDGDELREVLGAEAMTTASHERAGRLSLAMRYARLCRMLAEQELTVVIATISLFPEVHARNQAILMGYNHGFAFESWSASDATGRGPVPNSMRASGQS